MSVVAGVSFDSIKQRMDADPLLHGPDRTAADQDAVATRYLAELEGLAAADPVQSSQAAQGAKVIRTILEFSPEQRVAFDTFVSGLAGNEQGKEIAVRQYQERTGPTSEVAPESGHTESLWPVHARVSQEYGNSGHPGIDIAAPTGTPILAALSGTVVQASDRGDGYGITVVVKGDDGTFTRYAHQSEARVAEGDRVGIGQELGLVGSTGQSTGPHLHFEVRTGGEFGDTHDPHEYIAGRPE